MHNLTNVINKIPTYEYPEPNILKYAFSVRHAWIYYSNFKLGDGAREKGRTEGEKNFYTLYAINRDLLYPPASFYCIPFPRLYLTVLLPFGARYNNFSHLGKVYILYLFYAAKNTLDYTLRKCSGKRKE